MTTPILFDLSLTFPGLLSRLVSHSKTPFGSVRNSLRFRLLPSDYPLYWMSFGYSLRGRYNSTNVCTRSLFGDPFSGRQQFLSSTLDSTGITSDALESSLPSGLRCLDPRAIFFGSHLQLSHSYYG